MLKKNKSHSKDCKNLNEWLCYLETIHNTEIDLGLSRISQVAKRLNIDFSFACVITVAGTNGKGTTCAFLENALLGESINNQAVHDPIQNIAVYSSPHIEHFNERLRINKRNVDDQSLITAFEKIELSRGNISLSYYEYTTLAAFLVLMVVKPQVIILEVGLGGRLDATNIIDADVAVVTTVDIDHQAFLGNNRETIGFEKAGIMRAQQHIIIGDPHPVQSVLNHANKVNEALLTSEQVNVTQAKINHQQALDRVKVRNRDFCIAAQEPTDTSNKNWQWQCVQGNEGLHEATFCLTNLINPHIPQDNVATAIMVLKQLGVTLTSTKINTVIEQTQVAGRTELFKGNDLQDNKSVHRCDVMLDVGHNPHAGRYLSQKLVQLIKHKQYQRIIAVVAMLADKDISNTLAPFSDVIDEWYIAPLDAPRAATSEQMKTELARFTNYINCFDNITQAFRMANVKAESTDLILVFGSFYTVAQIRTLLI